MSMRAMKRAMAPPAHIERVLMSSGMNPTWGPLIVVAAHSAAVISALRIVDDLFTLKTAVRCVFGGALCCCKCATRRRMDATAHVRAVRSMTLIMERINTDTIRLVGRWRSDEMLRYLHTTAQTFTEGLAERMVQHGDYALISPTRGE